MIRHHSVLFSYFVFPALAWCVTALAAQERVVTGGPPPGVRAVLDAFVTAVNSGSIDKFQAMAKTHFAPPLLARQTDQQREAGFKQMTAEFGTIAIESVRRNGPGAPLNLAVKGSSGAAGVITLELEDSAPFRITSLAIAVGGRGGPDQPGAPLPSITGTMSKEDLAQGLDAYLSTFSADGRLSGVVLVAKDGKPLLEKAYGLADRSNNVPNTIATRFSLGSINKSFTQVAIAQLVAAGKLSYADTLGKVIPDYPQQQTRTATIEQLLRHTAGIADFFGEEFVTTPKDRFRSNADYYRFVSGKSPPFAPGTRNQYCNGCYITLGEIIERVSGMPYERYVAQHVFEPSGMSAAFPHADAIEPNIAQGYTRRGADGQIRNSIFMRGAAGSAAGGAYATAGDLLAFDNALRERRLLDEKGLARILSTASGGRSRVMGNFGIAGGAPGTNAVLESDGVWTVVVLTNFDPPTGESLGIAIQKALRAVTRQSSSSRMMRLSPTR